MFVMYIVADFCWLYFEPEAIPSLHGVIYFHHTVTLLLLLFPLKHKEFGIFTCLDGDSFPLGPFETPSDANEAGLASRRCQKG